MRDSDFLTPSINSPNHQTAEEEAVEQAKLQLIKEYKEHPRDADNNIESAQRVYKSWSGKNPQLIVELWPIVVAEKWVGTAVDDQIEHTQLSFKKAEKLLLEAEGKTSDAKDQDIADGRRPDLKLTFGGLA